MNRVFIYLEAAIIAVAVFYALHCIDRRRQEEEIDPIVKDLLVQQGKYIRCLDSTESYIYAKYGECLYDTLWEGDIYQDIYSGSEDSECWK